MELAARCGLLVVAPREALRQAQMASRRPVRLRTLQIERTGERLGSGVPIPLGSAGLKTGYPADSEVRDPISKVVITGTRSVTAAWNMSSASCSGTSRLRSR